MSDGVNFRAAAGLYHPLGRNFRRHSPIAYKRFTSVAAAIRFAIEQLPEAQLTGSRLEVDAQQYDSDQIRQLYNSASYPLKRRALSKAR